MNIGEIIRALLNRGWFIVSAGIIVAILAIALTLKMPAKYTSRATVFPLNSASSGGAGTSALSSLLGTSDPSKNFSSEASINIVELVQSRHVREVMASSRLADFGNKTVTELLIAERNKHRSFFSKKMQMPVDSANAARVGAMLLAPGIDAKVNKNSVLELHYTNTDSALIKPISELLIATISQFYISLRTQKAYADYRFTEEKIDSLESLISAVDNKAITYQNGIFFTPDGRLQYQLPQDNISTHKQRIVSEEDHVYSNKEEALWRLQKVTPIVAVLDHPDPPFAVEQPSKIIYGIVGFILGSLLACLLVIRKLLMRYAKEELQKLMQ